MFSRLTYKTQRKVTIALFLFLPLLFLCVFTFIPALNMFYYSFTSWNGFSAAKKLVGFKNYIKIFTNADYFTPLFNSIYYFFGGIIQITLAFFFAILLNEKIVGKNFFKGIYFFPYLVNTVAIGLMFMAFFQPDGTLNSALKLIGMGNLTQLWLDNPHLNNFCLAFTSVWYYFGYNFVIFLGAIQSISIDVNEAASLDGANGWQKTRYITIPSVINIIKLNLILNISGAISAYAIPFIMTGGSNGTSTFVIKTVETAFTLTHVGLASAMAIVVLIIVSIVTISANVLIKGDD
jgi:ABC-type sugar transport system permease subunit